jgi:dTMP kinase
MSLFITFEGGEGCGKSTQARILYLSLIRLKYPAVLIYEPGGTPLSNHIRRFLKQSHEIPITPLAELMLFNASRSQLVADVIQPSLSEGKIVICDRFTDSTIAYQHFGRGLERFQVTEVNRIASQKCQPDITFLLDISPEVGLSRKRQSARDRFEKENLDFHHRVRQGFLKLAIEEPDRWVVIDSTMSKSMIADLIREKVDHHLSC